MSFDIDELCQSMVKILGDTNDKVVGSGFLIRVDGYIVTCHHVIYNLRYINVEYREQKYVAQWCEKLSNIEVDIAILKIDVNDAKPVRVSLATAQSIPAIVYGFPAKEINQFPRGFDVCGILTQSAPVKTIATYNKDQLVVTENLWNRKPSESSIFWAYRINERVNPGISGGLVINRETGCAIGVIQSTRSTESYVISWKNILEQLKELGLFPYPKVAVKFNDSAKKYLVDEIISYYGSDQQRLITIFTLNEETFGRNFYGNIVGDGFNTRIINLVVELIRKKKVENFIEIVREEFSDFANQL